MDEINECLLFVSHEIIPPAYQCWVVMVSDVLDLLNAEFQQQNSWSISKFSKKLANEIHFLGEILAIRKLYM
jgi:hypothetical protein